MPGRTTGLLASLQQLLATVADVLYTRIEIISTELEEEGSRVRALLLYELVSLFFLGVGVLLATLFVVMASSDVHRLSVLGGFAAFYMAVGAATGLMARYKRKKRPGLFATTLSELGKDRERLGRDHERT